MVNSQSQANWLLCNIMVRIMPNLKAIHITDIRPFMHPHSPHHAYLRSLLIGISSSSSDCKSNVKFYEWILHTIHTHTPVRIDIILDTDTSCLAWHERCAWLRCACLALTAFVGVLLSAKFFFFLPQANCLWTTGCSLHVSVHICVYVCAV